MGWLNKLVFWIIPLIVLIILIIAFYGDDSLFAELKSAVQGVVDIAPTVNVGLEEIESEQPSVNEAQEKAILDLKEALEKMSGQEECFLDFGDLPSLENAGIEMVNLGGKTSFNTYGGEGGKQIVTELSFDLDFKPCVIAGDARITENFFNHFINGLEKKENHYREVNKIIISNDGDNIISVPNLVSNDFESEGWLYTPGNKIVCFFPTNKVKNYDQDGLANEWFSEEDNSIAKKIQRKELKSCD